MPLRAVLRSDTLRIVAVFAFSGVGFTGGSLILARVMSPAEFGAFALLLAVAQVTTPLGPLGVDMLVNRHRIRPGPSLFARVALQSFAISALITVIVTTHFGLAPALGAVLFLAGLLGALNRVAAAWFQSQHRHTPALWLSQSQNLAILLAALGVWLIAGDAGNAVKATSPALVVMAGYLVACVVGWAVVLRRRSPQRHRLPVVEGLAVVGAGGAELLLVQTDRLVIPSLLDIEQLATFAVLAATMGSPFRVLQLAAGYSTVPKIRAAHSIAERWRILAREARLLCLVTVAGCAAMWVASPWVVRLFVGDKYPIGTELMLAVVVGGVARVLGAFSSAAVTAVGAQRQLFALTLISWGSVAAGVAGAIVGARWGLSGIVYGVGIGWIMRAVGAALLLPASLNCPRLIDTPGTASLQRG